MIDRFFTWAITETRFQASLPAPRPAPAWLCLFDHVEGDIIFADSYLIKAATSEATDRLISNMFSVRELVFTVFLGKFINYRRLFDSFVITHCLTGELSTQTKLVLVVLTLVLN